MYKLQIFIDSAKKDNDFFFMPNLNAETVSNQLLQLFLRKIFRPSNNEIIKRSWSYPPWFSPPVGDFSPCVGDFLAPPLLEGCCKRGVLVEFSSTCFPALLCQLVLALFVGSLFSALCCWERSISFYAFGGQCWLTMTDSRS